MKYSEYLESENKKISKIENLLMRLSNQHEHLIFEKELLNRDSIGFTIREFIGIGIINHASINSLFLSGNFILNPPPMPKERIKYIIKYILNIKKCA
jgi:hypothetical protein